MEEGFNTFFHAFRSDIKAIILLLARSTSENVNQTVSARDQRTPLHLSCAIGNLAISQLLIWVSSFFLFFFLNIKAFL